MSDEMVIEVREHGETGTELYTSVLGRTVANRARTASTWAYTVSWCAYGWMFSRSHFCVSEVAADDVDEEVMVICFKNQVAPYTASLRQTPFAVPCAMCAMWLKANKERQFRCISDRNGGEEVALTQAGMAREDAYRLVQRHAMAVWNGEGGFLDRVRDDPQVTSLLGEAQLSALFDLGAYTKHVETIFARVLQEDAALTRSPRSPPSPAGG